MRACFSNTSTRLRTATVAADVGIQVWVPGEASPALTRDELSSIYGTQDDETPPETEVFTLSLDKGVITGIEQFPLGILAP